MREPLLNGLPQRQRVPAELDPAPFDKVARVLPCTIADGGDIVSAKLT